MSRRRTWTLRRDSELTRWARPHSSYVARNEDDSAVRSTWGGGQRPSVGQSLGINVPLLYEEEDEGEEAMNFRDDNGKKANDIPARLVSPAQLSVQSKP